MLSFPNCKINLGLNVVEKRSDGYHNLETVFYPIDLKDILEVVQAPSFSFTSTGLEITGDEENNLCVKAYSLLKKDFPRLPAVHIHLHKVIPMGAGLGGGSADGAFTLALLNKKFHLNLTPQQLIDYALLLGSDCPFFIVNQPAFAKGRGEILQAVNLDLSGYQFAIVNPGLHISTKTAFSHLIPKAPSPSIWDIITQPIETWQNLLKNDFEESAFKQHPEIGAIKNALYNSGAIYASMTGTGSTVYGLFRRDDKPVLNFPTRYLTLLLK